MRLIDLPPEAIGFLLKGHGLPPELGLAGLSIPFDAYYSVNGTAPNHEKFLASAIANTFKGDLTGFANFIAVAFRIPQDDLAFIFMESEDMDDRNEWILGGTYSSFCKNNELEEGCDATMDRFLAQAFMQTFMMGGNSRGYT